MKKYLLLFMICLLTLCGCGKIPKLANGEEAVITFAKDKKEHMISAEELYTYLKSDFGLEATLNMIDNYILEEEFASFVDTAKESAANQIEAMIEAYGSKETLQQEIIERTNYSTIEAYQNYLYITYMNSHALEEYAKTLVTDKEIEKYYKDEAKGDIEVYNILVTSKATNNMTTEEKEKKEKEAQDTIKEIISKLDKADKKLDTFKSLVKEYSEDETSKQKDGNLGYINIDTLGSSYDELVDAAYKLKDGEYSKEVITTELGYHVIYRSASKEKDTLDNLKDKIIETLANRKLSTNRTITVDYLEYYRKLYNVKIQDSEINKQYGIYINNLINSLNSTSED